MYSKIFYYGKHCIFFFFVLCHVKKSKQINVNMKFEFYVPKHYRRMFFETEKLVYDRCKYYDILL